LFLLVVFRLDLGGTLFAEPLGLLLDLRGTLFAETLGFRVVGRFGFVSSLFRLVVVRFDLGGALLA